MKARKVKEMAQYKVGFKVLKSKAEYEAYKKQVAKRLLKGRAAALGLTIGQFRKAKVRPGQTRLTKAQKAAAGI